MSELRGQKCHPSDLGVGLGALGVFACLWFGHYMLLISALRGLRGPRGLWGPRGSVDPVGGLLGLAASGLALSTMLFVFACCVEGVKPLLVKIT